MANLARYLDIKSSNAIDLSCSGTFGELQTDPRLWSDGKVMRGGSADNLFELPAEPVLAEALKIGLTRMGVLHNLARLSFGLASEKAAGGVKEWVEGGDYRLGESNESKDEEAAPVNFSITTNRQRSSVATLWISRESGLPVLREQTVQFPDGPMYITEKYLTFELR